MQQQAGHMPSPQPGPVQKIQIWKQKHKQHSQNKRSKCPLWQNATKQFSVPRNPSVSAAVRTPHSHHQDRHIYQVSSQDDDFQLFSMQPTTYHSLSDKHIGQHLSHGDVTIHLISNQDSELAYWRQRQPYLSTSSYLFRLLSLPQCGQIWRWLEEVSF